jgi:hypothetical protein
LIFDDMLIGLSVEDRYLVNWVMDSSTGFVTLPKIRDRVIGILEADTSAMPWNFFSVCSAARILERKGKK